MRWGLGILGVAVVAGVMMMFRGEAGLTLAGVISPETTPVPTTNWSLSIDCDAETAGVQSACAGVEGDGAYAATIVLRNISEAPRRLESFQVYVEADEAVLVPNASTCGFPELDCNPNFNDSMAGTLWECSTSADYEPDATIVASFMWCANGTDAALVPDDGPVIAAGESLELGSVTYGALAGSTAVTPMLVTVEDGDATQIMSCNPGNVFEGQCGSATVTLAPAAVDSDGDGYLNAAEIALGENPNSYCATMRADVNGNGSVNSLDLLQVSFGVGNYVERLDQNANGGINSLDLLLVSFQFGLSVTECAP